MFRYWLATWFVSCFSGVGHTYGQEPLDQLRVRMESDQNAPDQPQENVHPETVSFATTDGGLVFADLYGSGDRGVVLAHGGRFDKESWSKQAQKLSGAGFQVLAINFRGYGESIGPGQANPLSAPLQYDVLGAVAWLRSHGAKSVAVVGASMGGGFAAKAVAERPASIDRLVLLGATPNSAGVDLKCPKLYIMSSDDVSGSGPRLPGLLRHFEQVTSPKEMLIVSGSAHAQFMFETKDADRIVAEIVRFLSTPADVGN